MDSKMNIGGLKKGKKDGNRRVRRPRAQASTIDNSSPTTAEDENKLNDEDKAKLEEIKQVTIDHNVPEMYQEDMSNQILEQGQEQLQYALDNHKKGGIVHTKEEYMLMQRATVF